MNKKDILIATETAKGKTQLMIEAETGIPQPTISRRLKKPETKKPVNVFSLSLQDTADEVKTVLTNLVREYKTNTGKGRKEEIEKEHAFRCLQRIAEMTGMFPTHTLYSDSAGLQPIRSEGDRKTSAVKGVLRTAME